MDVDAKLRHMDLRSQILTALWAVGAAQHAMGRRRGCPADCECPVCWELATAEMALKRASEAATTVDMREREPARSGAA